MKTSPRTAAKLCWLMTVISFVIAGIGLYTTIVELIYVGLGMVVVFMIILPIFVCRCPNCGQKLPHTRHAVHKAVPLLREEV